MSRFNMADFHIGTYILQPYARTERHIKDLADCGIDTLICLSVSQNDAAGALDRKTLDLLEKYRIGAVVSGVFPGWWGGDGSKSGKMQDTVSLSSYESAAEKLRDHPAIVSLDTGDEPSALDFPHYGKLIAYTSEKFPQMFPYLNLYPNYASVAENSASQTVNQLGTATYEEYIDVYCKNVPTDYICYDFYIYSIDNFRKMFDNFRIVADACRKTGRAFWYVPQVNSNKESEFLSPNQLRYQAYIAMAYGVTALYWACWTAGWWWNEVLDKDGNKTEQYEKLQTVNAEIIALSKVYMRYRNVSTHLVGFENDTDMAGFPELAGSSLSTGVFMDVHAEHHQKLVIGQMVSRENVGEYALMICGADDAYDAHEETYEIVFNAARGKEISAVDTDGVNTLCKRDDGSYAVKMKSSHGVLLIAK